MISILDNLLGEKYREIVFKRFNKVAPKDRTYNKVTGAFESQPNKNSFVVYFVLPFSEDLYADLGVANASVPYDGIYLYTGTEAKCGEIVQISYKDLEQMFVSLPLQEQEPYIRWMSEETRNEFTRRQEEVRLKAIETIETLPIQKLTREATKADYLHLLYEMCYNKADQKFCWDCYNHDYTDFPMNPDYVANNRAFYALNDGTYFVVSKNNYDTFWASQGNGFESCFSLTSEHESIRGVPYWMAHRGFFMCYRTDGDIAKWSSFPGHKSKLPKMSCRAWGYLRPNGTLALGKSYNKLGDKQFFYKDRAVKARMGNIVPDNFVIDTDLRDMPYKTYFDDLNIYEMKVTKGSGSSFQGQPLDGTCIKKKLESTIFNKDIEYFESQIKTNGKWMYRKVLDCGLPDSKIAQIINKACNGSDTIEVWANIMGTEGECLETCRIYKSNYVNHRFFIRYGLNNNEIYIQERGEDNETFVASI